jgi:hypothetical protein
MSPNPHGSSFNGRTSTTVVDQTTPFAWSSDGTGRGSSAATAHHQHVVQPQRQQFAARNAAAAAASAVVRSDSRDSVHSTRSDSFCDRWAARQGGQQQGVDGDGNKCVGGDKPMDLSCRARSQDPLSQYSVQVITEEIMI